CAPRYVWFSQTLNRRDPVGTCYVARNSFREYSEYSPCRTRNWGHHRQGSCQAGLGASISKDGNRLYVGAVGSWYWQGQIYSINPSVQLPYTPWRGYAYGAGQLFSQSLNNRPAVVNTKEGSVLDDDSYLGYSVAVGDFGDGGGSGAAVGMPRGAGLLGKVILYTWNLTNYLNLTGEQLGSYFGYALCVSDLDGDGRDDLVIGAPLYTDLSNNKGNYETGRIYVFYQGLHFHKRFREFHKRDGKNSRSRFGLSLSTLGDINKDNYGDIAVGAPYDGPEGRGAVYIFHGSGKGIMEKPSQVIQAEDVVSTLSTFGFSVAGGMDLDENEYPDLVVGAYEADTAVYLRARPVVKLDATVTFRDESKQLSLDTKACKLPDGTDVVCTELSACLEYSGVGVDHKLDFDVQFVLDAKKLKSPRMFLLSETGRNIMNYTLRLDKDSLFCKSFPVYIKNGIRDKLTPLEAEMRYSLRTGSGSTLSSRRRVTRSLIPVLDQSKDFVRRDSISIQKNCGPDNNCIPDLKLSVTPSVNRYLLGSGHRLELDVIVENRGEDSFETTFTMGVPVGINYINIERMDNAEREFLVQCSAPSRTNNNTLRCDLGNPLPQNRLVHFKVLLKPSLTEVMKPRYEFKMNVNSTNPEQEFTTNDNTFKLTVPIWVDAELELRGVSEPRELHYKMTLYDGADSAVFETEVGPQLVHTYSITNKGPSSITEAEAYFVWPSFTFDDENILYLLEMPETEGPVRCDLVGDAKANALNLKLDRKKKLHFEESSSSSHSGTSSSSSTSVSSSSSSSSASSTFSSSSSGSSSGSRTRQGSQDQEHPDRRLTTLTEEERRRYEEEKKFGFGNEEELSRTSGSKVSGYYEQQHSSERSYRAESDHSRGRVHGSRTRMENERGSTDNYRGVSGVSQDRDSGGRAEDRRNGYGVEISAGGAEVGAAGTSRAHSSRNFSATWSENGEVPHRYSNYSYSNWTSGEGVSGMVAPAYGRGSDVRSSHHSSSSLAGSRHGYAREGDNSTYFGNSRSAGDMRHYSSNWSAGDRDNIGRAYQGTGFGGAGTHFTFSTETSDISDNIGARYRNSHLSSVDRTGLFTQGNDNRTRSQHHPASSTQDSTYGFHNEGSNQFGSELEESARGSGGFRHYIWTPQISGDPVSVDRSRHESSSSGLDSTRGHIGRNSHIGIETDNAAAGQQWYSGSGSVQHGGVDEEATRRQHVITPSSSYVWSSSDKSATAQHGSNNDYSYDTWQRGHSAYGANDDNFDVSQHYSSNYGRDYSGDRRGTGGSVDIARHYSSSILGSDDVAGQHDSGGVHRGGSQHYGSHYESSASWS
ncbi:hypothetical protein B7P43_G02308, partial [Cryptotermes secundus]